MSTVAKLREKARQQATSTQLSNSPGLGEVSALAERQLRLEDKVESLTQALNAANKELEEVSTKLIPQALDSVGLKDFTLTDGSKVEVKQFVSASIKKENRQRAHAWLRQNKFGDIISHDITVPFKQGEDKKATRFKKTLVSDKLVFEESERVHPSTLKAFITEQVENGVTVPLDLFGAFIGRKAKIKRPS